MAMEWGGKRFPFEVNRVYTIAGVPSGAKRGSHAHKSLEQVIVPVSGSFVVTLNDGRIQESYLMRANGQGLLLEPGLWREMHDFSKDAVCLVLASQVYDEGDYIRDFQDFLKWKSQNLSVEGPK